MWLSMFGHAVWPCSRASRWCDANGTCEATPTSRRSSHHQIGIELPGCVGKTSSKRARYSGSWQMGCLSKCCTHDFNSVQITKVIHRCTMVYYTSLFPLPHAASPLDLALALAPLAALAERLVRCRIRTTSRAHRPAVTWPGGIDRVMGRQSLSESD